jgi:hypothetical protein
MSATLLVRCYSWQIAGLFRTEAFCDSHISLVLYRYDRVICTQSEVT